PADNFVGSWSGAFGMTQFIPTSFYELAAVAAGAAGAWAGAAAGVAAGAATGVRMFVGGAAGESSGVAAGAAAGAAAGVAGSSKLRLGVSTGPDGEGWAPGLRVPVAEAGDWAWAAPKAATLSAAASTTRARGSIRVRSAFCRMVILKNRSQPGSYRERAPKSNRRIAKRKGSLPVLR
ncbi:lytic murein transglycosylase, partial [Achromobacter xylosoxidans]|uniref:lytic murein transglycosylase n=1 Tax=Alcaligenes xylosoxydans xylosoxydans TaxID=85698 RepID=UPI001F05CBA2